MKKHSIKLTALVLALVLTAALALTGCGSKSDDSDGATTIQIAVPNDTTNEARALLLLQDNGIIKLADGAGITATKNDIVENPYNVEIVETEAAQIPNILQDVDYAVINSNYAINAGLNPVADSLVIGRFLLRLRQHSGREGRQRDLSQDPRPDRRSREPAGRRLHQREV